MRLFVAIEIPEPIRRLLGEAGERLSKEGLRARYVRREGMHLTLRFLGETSPDRMAPLGAALAAAAAGSTTLGLGVGGLGTFPPRGRPRVLWAGLTGDLEALGSLAGSVEAAAVACGWPAEQRPFHPHVTLARFDQAKGHGGVGPERMPTLLHDAADLLGRAPGFAASELVLFESRLGRGGARYLAVDRFPLSSAVEAVP